MDHETCVRAHQSGWCAQPRHDAGRCYCSDVVKGQRRRDSAQQIVNGHTIRDVASGCLESQMNMSNVIVSGYSRGVGQSGNSGLIDWPGEYAPDFIGRLSRLGVWKYRSCCLPNE